MIVRIWRAKINPARLEDYRRFEAERCLPMLHKQPGLLGMLFLRQPKITRHHSQSGRTGERWRP